MISKLGIWKLTLKSYSVLKKINQVIQKCKQQEDVKMIKGTDLINNFENCEFLLKNQIIKNYKSVLDTEIKFIDFSEKHKTTPSIDLIQVPVSNITKEIERQEIMLNSISPNQVQHRISNYIIYSLLIVSVLIVTIHFIIKNLALSAQRKVKQFQ